MTLWFDVDDLVGYFNARRRPSGIQRLCFELYKEIWAQQGKSGDIRFCRHNSDYTGLLEIDWPALERLIAELTARTHPNAAAQSAMLAPGASNVAAPKRASLLLRLPAKLLLNNDLRIALGDAYYGAASAQKGLWSSLRAVLVYARLLKAPPKLIEDEVINFSTDDAMLRPGDVIVALGSLWESRFGVLIAQLRERYGVGFAAMFYDAIPRLHPEFTGDALAALFAGWLNGTLPQADRVFTISQTSANDLKSAMAQLNQRLPNPIILPIGARLAPVAASNSPVGKPFVLFVSTVEPRKNHALMLAVWARMLNNMRPDDVPNLVFAGRVMVDVSAMLDAAGNAVLRNHLVVVREPEDHVLVQLYAQCLFTVFPSLYEGWGLPVTESLSFGKTVAASNRASIPEAGGEFCAYFDPENVDDAYQVIRGMIEHPERVASLEARIAEKFAPPSWADTATALLEGLSTPKAVAKAPEILVAA